MNSQSFIVKELDLFLEMFPQAKVRYEYDKDAVVHVVEVVPIELYHFDNEYIAWENDVFERFITAFPLENLCFVSEDSLVGIRNPIFTRKGKDFEIESSKSASKHMANGSSVEFVTKITGLKADEISI